MQNTSVVDRYILRAFKISGIESFLSSNESFSFDIVATFLKNERKNDAHAETSQGEIFIVVEDTLYSLKTNIMCTHV